MRLRADRKSAPVSLRPLPIKAALRFIREVHRRLPKLQGAMWAIGADIDDRLVGVAVVGHPQARLADDGVSLEVTRVATYAAIDGGRNACSALYGGCARAARAMGGRDMWTSVHQDEHGESLKAAGWINLGLCGGGEWSRDGRQRQMAIDPQPKIKWAVPWGRLGVARLKLIEDARNAMTQPSMGIA